MHLPRALLSTPGQSSVEMPVAFSTSTSAIAFSWESVQLEIAASSVSAL